MLHFQSPGIIGIKLPVDKFYNYARKLEARDGSGSQSVGVLAGALADSQLEAARTHKRPHARSKSKRWTWSWNFMEIVSICDILHTKLKFK